MASSVSFSPSTSAETRSLITSSAGWARRSATMPGEVLAQRLGGGDAPVDVRHQADELDGPALELGEVLLGQAQQACDHPDRELKGQLTDQVGLAVGGEAVDLLVNDGADELGLPAGQRLLAERMGHEVAVAAVLRVVHAQDHVAHDHTDGHVVAGRGECLGVPQNPRAVLVAVGDPSRLDLDALGQRFGRDGQALVHRGVAALDHEVRVGVSRRAGHHVVEGGERVVFVRVRKCHAACPSRWCSGVSVRLGGPTVGAHAVARTAVPDPEGVGSAQHADPPHTRRTLR